MRRRTVLTGLGAGAALIGARIPARAASPMDLSPLLPDGTRAEAVMDALPGKQPLIKLAYRPPNYETPIDAFGEAITPNDRFFLRYHLPGIPDVADLEKAWSVKIGGDAAGQPLSLSLDELQRQFPVAEVEAVNQCSGCRRGLFSPHVPGVQWGYGAMGSAVWRGVRLKDVLARAGVRAGAVEVAFGGADGPVMEGTPDFAKSLPLEKAMDENTLIAFAMNGAKLPHLNGLPIRLIVPGWTGTYWMKHLNEIEIRSKPFDGFWMQKSYRVPKGMFAVDLPFTTQAEEKTVPITEMVVNSVIGNIPDGSRQPAVGFTIQGVAWDRGHGIKQVEVSTDGGANWKPATLREDHGKYAFRAWRFDTGKLQPGAATVMARATSNAGETQETKLKPNPAGYHNNVPQKIAVTLA